MPWGPSAGSNAFVPFFSVRRDETTFQVPTSLCFTSAALDCAHTALLNRHAIKRKAIFRMAVYYNIALAAIELGIEAMSSCIGKLNVPTLTLVRSSYGCL